MATVLEESTTEEQCSVMRFCWQKDSMKRIFVKKYFLFMVRSVCRLKQFTTLWQTFRWWRRSWSGGAEVAETTVRRLLCRGFRHTGRAIGQEYQCWWRICWEINALLVTYFTFYIHFWPIYWLAFILKMGKLVLWRIRRPSLDNGLWKTTAEQRLVNNA
jgi:hypothetical protein